MSIPGLTEPQELFCVEYAATQDAVLSYKKAFNIQTIPDEKATEYAAELLDHDTIRERIIRLQNTASPKEVLTKQRVLEELSQIVKTALFQADRIRALDLLGKYYKLFSEKDNPQKVYVGQNKIQIIYMSPDHKRITSVSPLRNLPEIPEALDLPQESSDPDISTLEKDLDSILE